MRAKGDEDAAASVKRLRKPSLPAWAINQTARRQPDAVAELLRAGADLREAQQQALAGDASRLRPAAAALTGAVERLAGLAIPLLDASPIQQERILATLRAAAIDEDAGDQLRRGVLVEDLEPVGFGELAGPSVPSPPARARRNEEIDGARREARRAEAEADAAEARARRRAERAEAAAERAQEAHRAAEAARAEAEEAAGEATAARRRAEEASARLAAPES